MPLPEPTPAALIRALREAAGLSQQDLAVKTGVTQSAISRIEGGKALPGLAFLSQVLEALDCQLTLGTAPLWSAIDAAIDDAAQRSVEEVFEEATLMRFSGGFDLMLIEESLADIEHRYGGLTAAALLGAPVPVKLCDLVLRDDEQSKEAFQLWMGRQDGERWNKRLQMFFGASRDPRDPGSSRWRTFLGEVWATFVPELPDPVMVRFHERQLAVVPFPNITTTDAYAARVLARMRQRMAENTRLASGM